MTRTARNSRVTRVNRLAAREAAMQTTNSHGRVGFISNINKDTLAIIKVVAVVLLTAFVFVSLQAYTATLQYKNNCLTEDNAYLQAEIDSMKSQIVDETKITSIEKTATEKYDMVYPTAENCVAIKEDKAVSNNELASKIKKRAYN